MNERLHTAKRIVKIIDKRKKLSDMTLKELWQIFPIQLAEHRDCWQIWYAEESATVMQLLAAGDDAEAIAPSALQGFKMHHIGSTAIDGIMAKPIIDLLLEVPGEVPLEQVKEKLIADGGYLCMSETPNRISLNKGYTEEGYAERVFHLHLRFAGDCDEVYFRDYLNAHPYIAKDYELLKKSLLPQYQHDRDGYTAQKTAFIKEATLAAKKEAGIL